MIKVIWYDDDVGNYFVGMNTNDYYLMLIVID